MTCPATKLRRSTPQLVRRICRSIFLALPRVLEPASEPVPCLQHTAGQRFITIPGCRLSTCCMLALRVEHSASAASLECRAAEFRPKHCAQHPELDLSLPCAHKSASSTLTHVIASQARAGSPTWGFPSQHRRRRVHGCRTSARCARGRWSRCLRTRRPSACAAAKDAATAISRRAREACSVSGSTELQAESLDGRVRKRVSMNCRVKSCRRQT